MGRFVDADELKTAFPCGESVRTESVRATIDHMATVDAEPVKHGEWIPKITELGTMVFRCSVCQRLIDIHWAYCPRCGAKMDGERKEDETC